ncbi:MAG: hypothetical protein ACREFP_14100, partial [Acetobacteraceae bacterium]
HALGECAGHPVGAVRTTAILTVQCPARYGCCPRQQPAGDREDTESKVSEQYRPDRNRQMPVRLVKLLEKTYVACVQPT